MKLIRSRAPLRMGLAGGGTDVSPYADLFGGSILNATINLYASASIRPRTDGKIHLEAFDRKESVQYDAVYNLPIDGTLDLLKGVYNRIVKDFTHEPLSFELCTSVDAPAGSGLGSSSTLVVAIIGAFAEWLKLPLGEYDIAHLAYQIERVDLKLAGGRQDQYAATFGGFNFMEFYKEEKVIVNPLRIRKKIATELQNNIVLFYTGTSRESAEIIKKQSSAIQKSSEEALQATHRVKEQSTMMKEALLRGELDRIGEILHFGWEHKKRMASGISNSRIEELYDAARAAGATGGKISGAGGGGFMFFYCPNNTRFKVIEAISQFDGRVKNYEFAMTGLYSYTIGE
ncbi:MAG: dehydrogenase [Flavobacteriales bacterium]|nr:dehydrogenase [Bacteroidota bacterium]MCB9240006.1 dehydrogenase [Flavobacteriales bacterium]